MQTNEIIDRLIILKDYFKNQLSNGEIAALNEACNKLSKQDEKIKELKKELKCWENTTDEDIAEMLFAGMLGGMRNDRT